MFPEIKGWNKVIKPIGKNINGTDHVITTNIGSLLFDYDKKLVSTS